MTETKGPLARAGGPFTDDESDAHPTGEVGR